MNKTAIRNFAIWAREELISRVSRKAVRYGISEGAVLPVSEVLMDGKVLSEAEQLQRERLVEKIANSGYTRTVEEIAYTWFNRFCTLRYMEVNGFLPHKVRIFSNDKGEFHPQIIAGVLSVENSDHDRETLSAPKGSALTEESFKYSLILQCNALNAILPGAFPKIDGETALLSPDGLLCREGIIARLVDAIPEDQWQNSVQIVGWLYQYYNTEPKEQVFAALKNNIKISKENIPAATQLFTPDWIVRYMVENTLGRLFINSRIGTWKGTEADRRQTERHIAEKLGWKYYLPEPEQTPKVRAELNAGKYLCDLSSLKVIDPCMGSGHILVYVFDLLMQIYREYGYDDRTAVAGIVSNNLFGLDIDEHAAQLAYFAVMMKARHYDHGFFERNIRPGVYTICESDHISPEHTAYFCGEDPVLRRELARLLVEMRNAREYGSILNVSAADFGTLHSRLERLRKSSEALAVSTVSGVAPLIQCAEVMTQMYDVVVTNPPYMSSSNMDAPLNRFIKENYADFRYDFFAAFIVKCSRITKREGLLGFFVPYVWMFIKSYEKLRHFLYDSKTIENLIQFEYSAFEEATVPVCAFTFSNEHFNKRGGYIRLVDFKGGMEVQREKTLEAVKDPHCGFYFEQSVKKFLSLPGAPAAYWISDRLLSVFDNEKLADRASPRQGLATGCNDLFTRLWFECASNTLCFSARSRQEAKESGCRWFPYNKGGDFRKWYGNNDFVVNWENDGSLIRNFKSDRGGLRSRPQNMAYYFKESITWSKISSGTAAFRYKPCGHIFDVAGTSVFADTQELLYLLGLCNSKVTMAVAGVISPTMNYEVGHIASLPLKIDEKQKKRIVDLVKRNISLSKADWDSFETSWDFVRHPLAVTPCANGALISEKFEAWQGQCEKRFTELKTNEEELNRIFIELYGLQKELSPEVTDKEVTVRRADAARDVRSFISYAVGCMLGRYSLDAEGVVYGGGIWTPEKYRTFPAAGDNLLLIGDRGDSEDDLTGRFIKFVSKMYGSDTLEENLKFITRALGHHGAPREVLCKYFRNDFFANHCKIYQKRPIYWLFDSGKKGGFKALIYIHRYRPETLTHIQRIHLPEQQERCRAAIAAVTRQRAESSGAEKIKLANHLVKLKAQAEEMRLYAEKLRLYAEKMIVPDPDAGIKSNYAIFRELLAKIR